MKPGVALTLVTLGCGPALAQAPHACSLVKREALEAAVGVPLKEGRRLVANCIYDAASGKAQLMVQVRAPGDPLNDFEDRKKALRLAGGTLSAVAGLGDEASWAAGPDHLVVRKAGYLVYVDPGLVGTAPPKERAAAIAKAVLSSLP